MCACVRACACVRVCACVRACVRACVLLLSDGRFYPTLEAALNFFHLVFRYVQNSRQFACPLLKAVLSQDIASKPGLERLNSTAYAPTDTNTDLKHRAPFQKCCLPLFLFFSIGIYNLLLVEIRRYMSLYASRIHPALFVSLSLANRHICTAD